MQVKAGFYYSEEHEWVSVEDDIATIGITDYAQSKLGDIVYVELPEEGDTVEVGDTLASVESVKSASDLYAPISGEIIAINEELEDEPGLINQDAFDAWVVKVRMDDESQLQDLMSDADYEAFTEED